jgi:hypothetical protein
MRTGASSIRPIKKALTLRVWASIIKWSCRESKIIIKVLYFKHLGAAEL